MRHFVVGSVLFLVLACGDTNPLVGAGGNCAEGGTCEAGTVCFEGACRPEPGQPCDTTVTRCLPGSVCEQGQCRGAGGTTCLEAAPCASAFRCEAGTCASGPGAACGDAVGTPCYRGLVCLHATCFADIGSACDGREVKCAPGSRCDGGICLADPGSLCSQDADCASGYRCHAGMCRGTPGAECSPEVACAPGLTCEQGECRADAREPCDENARCVRGLVCEAGECKGVAGAECVLSADCATQYACSAGQCLGRTGAACDEGMSCAPGNVCERGECRVDIGGACGESAGCASGLECEDGTCRAGLAAACLGSDECRTGFACAGGACRAVLGGSCLGSSDCTPGLACDRGLCRGTVGGACATDSLCSSGLVCEDGGCIAVAGGACQTSAECARGMTCVAGSCRKPTGGACALSNQCEPGDVCQDGVCRAPLDGACSLQAPCVAGLLCEAGSCRLGVGGLCSESQKCASTLACVNGACRAGAGGACSETAQCQPGLACDDGVCRPGLAEACSGSVPCAGSLVCESGYCVGTLATACAGSGECATGLVCDAFACRSIAGGRCDNVSQCVSGLACEAGVCVVPRGSACGEAAACGGGLSCVGGVCRVDEGGACGGDGDCAPGFVCAQQRCGPAPVASVVLSPAPPWALRPNATLQLSAKVLDGQGRELSGRVISWNATLPSVATVSTMGFVTAVASGDTTLQVSAGGVSAAGTLSVRAPPHVTNVDPPSGPPGSLVTVSGTGFGLTRAAFDLTFTAEPGGATNGDVLQWGETKIVVRVPGSLPAGRYGVAVEGGGEASNRDSFFTVVPQAYVSSVSPRRAPPGALLTVTITGTSLVQGGTPCTVSFNQDGVGFPGLSLANPARVVLAGAEDRLELEVDVAAGVNLATLAVACGNSTAELTEDNVFSVVSGEGMAGPQIGSGLGGFFGDGAPASIAKLRAPAGLALGTSGELYVADTDNHRIRVVNTNGTGSLTIAGVVVQAGGIASIAGGGGATSSTSAGFSGDGGAARESFLRNPRGLAFDARRGLLFVADTGNDRVRVINVGGSPVQLPGGSLAAGAIWTVAGGAGASGPAFGDGGPASEAALSQPQGIALDDKGVLYVADTGHHRIRAVNTGTASVTNAVFTVGLASGAIATLAGDSQGFMGDGDDVSVAMFNAPTAVAVGAKGLVFVADSGNHVVRVVNTSTANVTVLGASPTVSGPGLVLLSRQVQRIAGTGIAGSSGDNGASRSALLNNPVGLDMGPFGLLFVTDRGNNRVRVIGTGDSPVRRSKTWWYASWLGTLLSQTGLSAAVVCQERGMLYYSDSAGHVVRSLRIQEPRDLFGGDSGAWPGNIGPGAATLDTDTGEFTYKVNGLDVKRRLGPVNGVFSFHSGISIPGGTTLTVVGSRPAVIAARGDIDILGEVLATSGELKDGPTLISHNSCCSTYGARGGGSPAVRYDGSFGAGTAYGTASLMPLVAGSTQSACSSGGGALLFVAGTASQPGNLSIGGAIRANGSICGSNGSYSSSGGGLRLVAYGTVTVAADAKLEVAGAYASYSNYRGGTGRVRIESLGPSTVPSGTVLPAANANYNPLSVGPISPQPWF